MIERILTPLDGSLTAESILPQARRLARKTDAEIVLSRSVPALAFEGGEAAFRAELDASNDYLAGVQERLEKSGFRVRSVVRAGGAAQTIIDLAGEIHADLIALATHGRGGLPRLVLGSVAEKILRSTPVPVLAVRPFWTYEVLPAGGLEARPVRTLLVPVGSGGLSLCALPHAVQMAKTFGSRVMVLHATSPHEAIGEETVTDVAERFRLEGLETTTLVEPGDPAERVLSACRTRAVDLVVMSTHGRGGVSRLVLGSVTEEVLRQARVPLLIVRGDPGAKVAWGLRSGSASSR